MYRLPLDYLQFGEQKHIDAGLKEIVNRWFMQSCEDNLLASAERYFRPFLSSSATNHSVSGGDNDVGMVRSREHYVLLIKLFWCFGHVGEIDISDRRVSDWLPLRQARLEAARLEEKRLNAEGLLATYSQQHSDIRVAYGGGSAISHEHHLRDLSDTPHSSTSDGSFHGKVLPRRLHSGFLQALWRDNLFGNFYCSPTAAAPDCNIQSMRDLLENHVRDNPCNNRTGGGSIAVLINAALEATGQLPEDCMSFWTVDQFVDKVRIFCKVLTALQLNEDSEGTQETAMVYHNLAGSINATIVENCLKEGGLDCREAEHNGQVTCGILSNTNLVFFKLLVYPVVVLYLRKK